MVTEIRVGISRTKNMRDYNSRRTEAAITMAVAEGDNFQKKRAEAIAEVLELYEQLSKAQEVAA